MLPMQKHEGKQEIGQCLEVSVMHCIVLMQQPAHLSTCQKWQEHSGRPSDTVYGAHSQVLLTNRYRFCLP